MKWKLIGGAPLDIDNCRPLDVEKEFFTAARDMWASRHAQEFLKREKITIT